MSVEEIAKPGVGLELAEDEEEYHVYDDDEEEEQEEERREVTRGSVGGREWLGMEEFGGGKRKERNGSWPAELCSSPSSFSRYHHPYSDHGDDGEDGFPTTSLSSSTTDRLVRGNTRLSTQTSTSRISSLSSGEEEGIIVQAVLVRNQQLPRETIFARKPPPPLLDNDDDDDDEFLFHPLPARVCSPAGSASSLVEETEEEAMFALGALHHAVRQKSIDNLQAYQ